MRTYQGSVEESTVVISQQNREALQYKCTPCRHIRVLEVDNEQIKFKSYSTVTV